MNRGARWGRHLVVAAAALGLVLIGPPGLPAGAAPPPSSPTHAAIAVAGPASAVMALRPCSLINHPRVEFPIGADDLRTSSGLTAAQITFLDGHLAGLGPVYLATEERSHVNARYLLAHAIEKSAWGSSDVAREKHNLYGYGAIDWNPDGGRAELSRLRQRHRVPGPGWWRGTISAPPGPLEGAPTLNGMHRHSPALPVGWTASSPWQSCCPA